MYPKIYTFVDKNLFINKKRNMKKELTYEEIGRLKKEQEKLIAEGKIQKPQIIKGFTPEDRRDFETGTKIEDYIRKKGFSL